MNDEVKRLETLKYMLDVEVKVTTLIGILIEKEITTAEVFQDYFKQIKESDLFSVKYKKIDDKINEYKNIEKDPIGAIFNMMKQQKDDGQDE